MKPNLKFFQSQYEELNDIVDDVAERGRTIGGCFPFKTAASWPRSTASSSYISRHEARAYGVWMRRALEARRRGRLRHHPGAEAGPWFFHE